MDKKETKWRLNISLDKLTVNERKNSLILLFFLNEYQEQNRAFKKLKSFWIDNVYKLPKTSEKGYNTAKNGRYNTLKKMKFIYQQYLVEIEDE